MTNDKGETFGEWLLTQRDREGWIGDLVKAARADPKLPKRGAQAGGSGLTLAPHHPIQRRWMLKSFRSATSEKPLVP
jgi:hypothetical protein